MSAGYFLKKRHPDVKQNTELQNNTGWIIITSNKRL